MAALALCASSGIALAGEAPATSAASREDTEKKLAEAQLRLNAAARDVAELSAGLGRRVNMQFGFGQGEGAPPPRALLGVSIGTGAEKDGAHVVDVSPGGAAAEAGIKAGDIITAIAGHELTQDSSPGRALVEKMTELDPGQKVLVALLRDGKKLNFNVAPRAAPPNVVTRVREMMDSRTPGAMSPNNVFATPAVPGVRQFIMQGAPARIGPDGAPGGQWERELSTLESRIDEAWGDGTRFGGVEFASLSERLGSYFGVKTGVLVVRAGANSPFSLQDGDVILSIDGRVATNAQQAGRILRSYQPGEKLTLKVQRDRKPLSVDTTAPGARDRD